VCMHMRTPTRTYVCVSCVARTNTSVQLTCWLL
jgi:hypothetical protein